MKWLQSVPVCTQRMYVSTFDDMNVANVAGDCDTLILMEIEI